MAAKLPLTPFCGKFDTASFPKAAPHGPPRASPPAPSPEPASAPVDTYEAGQRIQLNPVAGGDTEFGPCFEWLEERGMRPQSLVFLTDLYGSFSLSAPDYRVLWASTGSQKAPFGEVIPMRAA